MRDRFALVLVLVGLQLLLIGPLAADSFTPPREIELPSRFSAARDIRLAGGRVLGSEIALLLPDGLWATTVDQGSESVVRLLAAAGRGSGGAWAAASAALDGSTVAIAAPADEVVVNRASKPPVRVALAGIFDVDLRDGLLAVFGVQRVEDQMAPDGAIAFVVPADSGELKPVLFAASGPGAPATVGCDLDRSGALRFAPDGGMLIAPGTEPGVHLLDREFRPMRVWAGPLLPTGPRCPRTLEEQMERGVSPRLRLQALNAMPSIEDVFFAGGDPWVVVRQPVEKGVSWYAVRLLPDGSLRRVELGLPQATEYTRLKVDATGRDLVVLTYETPPDARYGGARVYAARLLDENGAR